MNAPRFRWTEAKRRVLAGQWLKMAPAALAARLGCGVRALQAEAIRLDLGPREPAMRAQWRLLRDDEGLPGPAADVTAGQGDAPSDTGRPPPIRCANSAAAKWSARHERCPPSRAEIIGEKNEKV